jgi:hypothetical protein
MKKYNALFKLTLFVSLFLVFSCETVELDKADDAFNLIPSQAKVDFLLNGIQEDFVRQIDGDADYSTGDNWQSGGSTNGDGLSLFGAELTRMYAMSNTNSRNYNNVYQANDSDDEWTNAYAGILKNIRIMTPLALAEGKTHHLGIAQFIEAYTMTAMVDFYGDIPYSQTIDPNNFNPSVDSGAAIYAACINLLDEAITNFESTATANPTNDLFYNNNYSNWVKAANTLKMKLYLQTRLVDNTAISKFNAIVATGNYITNSSEDLVFKWGGTSQSNPDNRHPRFGLNYTTTGANDYCSNWLMGTMLNSNDPRIRYYFYRQRSAVPGQEIPANEENLRCSFQVAPAHYVNGNYTFCSLPEGYWGRDHGDDDGLPPDGFLKTTFGVYPAGGKFDGDNFTNISPNSGGKGKGITPILLASWVDFMKAEIAMSQNNIALSKTEMLNGIQKSIDKVMSFGGNDPDLNSTFVPSSANITNFINNISSDFDIATNDGKWNILSTQFFIACYGNGIETYNYYRRTGFPTRLQPNRSPNPGNFVRSLYYPSVSVNNNSSISQKANQAVPVFWNTNSSPIAN